MYINQNCLPVLFFNSEAARSSPIDMVSADIYVWNSCRLVAEDGEARARSWKSLVYMKNIYHLWTVSAALVSSDASPVKLEHPVADNASQNQSNAKAVSPTKVNTDSNI